MKAWRPTISLKLLKGMLIKDKEHEEDDKPEVVVRGVKDREHKENDKEEEKGGFLEKVKDFIHDIGEKNEGAIGFGSQLQM